MSARLLVACATKHGGTAEIAQAIGATARAYGLEADVVAAREVRSLDGYDAVVLGSAVYMGRWQGDAVALLKRREKELAARPTWLFSSGPTGGSPEADAAVDAVQADPGAMAPPREVARRVARIRARGHATFAGRVGPEMNGFLERWMPRGDWRDFDVVRAWAGRVARAVASPAAPEEPALD
ncbi:MAG TPA: flavodoxin domain-containing protein [Candidatus Limnocylindria bacterium]